MKHQGLVHARLYESGKNEGGQMSPYQQLQFRDFFGSDTLT